MILKKALKSLLYFFTGCGSGMLDRSPCGSGTAAIVASNWSKGIFRIGKKVTALLFLALQNCFGINLSYVYIFIHILIHELF